VGETPSRRVLRDVLHESFERVRILASQVDGLHVAYSVKTNPRATMLHTALRAGFYAEAISSQEIAAAQRAGFNHTSVIYNGPRPLDHRKVFCAFADSPEAFKDYGEREVSDVLGLRYRPAGIDSRFGVPRSDFPKCLLTGPQRRLAISFHVRPQDYGTRNWIDIARETIEAGAELEALLGAPLVVLDLGGGFTPEQLTSMLEHEMPAVRTHAFERLRHLQQIFIEPGQGLATPAEAVYTRILEVRDRKTHIEAVVDAGVPWLPQIASQRHRIYKIINGEATLLSPGNDVLAGSTCLEYDVLARNVALPADCRIGDLYAVADAGAYDASMAYSFARGVVL
jgi:diaminopimelate decarboxylase